jgi:bifunctional UDP-N-acetylglucosamine pyrophosphorylase/glucosamine-1-phosphate N-acetyltransferase
MQAVMFCAGKSTRTYPLTVTRPKPLLKIMDKTILEHNLLQLEGLVDEAILIVGFKEEMIRERFQGKFGKIRLTYITQKDVNGTGGALLSAKEILKDRFLVMNGDDLFSRKDIERCLKHDSCVLGKEVDDLSRFGEIIEEKGIIREIKEKPGKKGGIANTGLYVLTKKIFMHELKKSSRGELEIVDFLRYADAKLELLEGYWFPMTYPWNLLEANEFFLKQIKKEIKGEVEKGATLKGEIIVGKGTIIKAGSYIEGPVMIGEDCVIGPNCYIRAHSVIGDRCKVGNAVEIKNSILGDGTSVGHLSYVGDSVLGNDVNFAAGTITANLRHDDQNVKSPVKGEMVDSQRRKLGAIIGDDVHTGINTSIYPGRKIWPGKTTLPGEIVKKDLE